MAGISSNHDRLSGAELIDILRTALIRLERGEDPMSIPFLGELYELKRIIEEARREIGWPEIDEIHTAHIPTATDELDAVVWATEEATGAIMDSCEEIQRIAKNSEGDASDAIEAEITKIFEACSFQDITGQRIGKVVTTLKTIERRVLLLLDGAGAESGTAPAEGAVPGAPQAGGKELLSGPQLPGKAISQDDIDKILKGF